MTEPAPSVATLPAPRRVAIATLLGEAWHAEHALAALYAGFAQRTPIPYLRGALEGLAEAKRGRIAALAALAPALAPDAGDGIPELHGTLPPPPEHRPDLFARAFEAERTLETTYRELLVLLDDPARCPGLPPLVAESARHRARLRALYLRYS